MWYALTRKFILDVVLDNRDIIRLRKGNGGDCDDNGKIS